MSRFEDTLQRDLAVIADRATPSPDAWQQILVRIVDQEPIEETEIIMLVENQERPRRWPVYAAAAAVVALVAAVVALVAARDDGETPADDPTPVTTPAPDDAVDEEGGSPVDDAETEAVDEPVDDPVEAAEPVTTAAPEVVDEVVPADLLPPAGQVAEGRYATDYIGTDLTFEVTSAAEIPWNTLNRPGSVWLYTGAGDEFVEITRISGWYDADQAVDPVTFGFGTIAPDDIDGLIAGRPDLLIDDLGEVEVAGRAARLFELSLDPASTAGEGICDPTAQPCTWFVSSSADGPGNEAWRANSLQSGRLVRSYVIDMDGYEPILVAASTTRDDQEAWLDEVFQPIVDSIDLGEPTHAVEGGRASLTTSVVATGTWTDADYTEIPRDDGSFDVTYVTTFAGDVRGDSQATSYRTPDPDNVGVGGGRFEFTGEIDGLGSGTLTMREEYVTRPIFLSVAVITGGTGDFEGATGWALFDPNSEAGTYEMLIEVPRVPPAEVATDTVTVESEFVVGEASDTAGVDGTGLATASVEFTGGVAGSGGVRSRITEEPVGTTRGMGTHWVTVTVDGVGTGPLLLEGPFRYDDTGDYIGMANVVAADGDLAGVTGTVRFESADAGATGTATFELEIPTD